MAGKVIRVGIAGFGRSGCNIHKRWLVQDPEHFKIVAVADQLPERREEAKTELGARVYDDYKDLLNAGGFDLFINSTPSYLHPEAAIAAFKKGYHVICEKPSSWNVADFDKMVAASQKSGKLFLPFQNSRFYPFWKKMWDVINSEVLGELIHVRFNYSSFGRRWDWQTRQEFKGGNLLNTGPHPLDLALHFFHGEQPNVFAQMKAIQPFGGDGDDFTSVTLHKENFPMVEIVLSSYMGYPQGDQFFIGGKFGSLAGNSTALRWKYFDPETSPVHELWKPWSQDRQYCSENLQWIENSWKIEGGYFSQFEELSQGFYKNIYDVLANGAKPLITPEQVRRQVIVLEECWRQNPLPKKA
ncbi:Gfo/Idh/MocA family oxidoreductase [bacterium]|nr:Gfo/Idh/MocA family oxidoreductase [bacterium]